MTLDDVLTLSRAGYTKEEISAFIAADSKPSVPGYEPKHEAKNEPKDEPKDEPKQEPENKPDPITSLQAELASLREEMHTYNISKTEQPERKTVDDILMAAMKEGGF